MKNRNALTIIQLNDSHAYFGHGYGFSRGSGIMGGYGYGMGPGMARRDDYGMGPGMMGGYGSGGYGMGRGYGRQSQSTGKSIDAKEAEAMMKDYLKSTRNPNLKLGISRTLEGPLRQRY